MEVIQIKDFSLVLVLEDEIPNECMLQIYNQIITQTNTLVRPNSPKSMSGFLISIPDLELRLQNYDVNFDSLKIIQFDEIPKYVGENWK